MKILLTTLNSKFIHSNLAIRYLRANLKKLPVEVKLMEFNINQNLDYIMAEIYKTRSELIGFSCYIWNIVPILELCTNLKKVAPGVKIVLGGPEVSFDPELIMQKNPAVDYIVRGEGELTFNELIETLLADREVLGLAGLTYRHNGGIISGPERPLIANLDDIPSPYTADFAEYANKLVYYESSRGCPFNCQYCLSSTFKGVRTFSRPRIFADLQHLINAEVEKVKFVDRTFNFDPQHALQIMRFLAANQRKTTYHFEITAHLITEETLEFLQTVPPALFQFEIGVQSTYLPALQEIKRVFDFPKLAQTVKTIASYQNIHLHLDLIAGLPREDYQHFQQSFNDVISLKPGNLQLGFLKLLKGSGIRENAANFGYAYVEQPPYEILTNNLLSFDEILELKMVEDLLETYYNSHKCELAVDFIITRFYQANPYLFFKELKDFWEAKDLHHRPHKDAALVQILYEFYQTKIGEDISIFQEILKYDYLRNVRTNLLPEWLNPVKMEDYRERLFSFVNDVSAVGQYIPELAHLGGKQILRRIQVEPFAFDIFAYRESGFTGIPAAETTFILFDYELRDPIFGLINTYQVVI